MTMDKETEKQALEAYCDKCDVPKWYMQEIADGHSTRVDNKTHLAQWPIWLAAWEARGRASGQQGVEISHALQNELIEYFKQDFKSASSWDFTDQRKAEISVLLEAASPQITSPAIVAPAVHLLDPGIQPSDSVPRWQPIYTAPKDRTLVDLWHEDGFKIQNIFWVPEYTRWSCASEDQRFIYWSHVLPAPST